MAARILVIEDNRANLELMTYLLKAFGYEPLVAQDGGEGVDKALRELPDVILCDVQLPTVSGYQVVQRLRSDPRFAKVPVVAVTALAMVGDREKLLAAGFDGYISKPIAPETLVSQVEAFLSKPLRAARPAAAAAPAAVERQEPQAVPQAPDKGATILVVDDAPANRDLMTIILRRSGYRVATATSVQEAFELIDVSPPDLILSDLNMPDGDGCELLVRLKGQAQLAAIPFILLSASIFRDSERRNALALGAEQFVERPVEADALLKLVGDALSRRGKERDGDDPRR